VFYDNDIVKVTDFFIQKNFPIDAIILPQQELSRFFDIEETWGTATCFSRLAFGKLFFDRVQSRRNPAQLMQNQDVGFLRVNPHRALIACNDLFDFPVIFRLDSYRHLTFSWGYALFILRVGETSETEVHVAQKGIIAISHDLWQDIKKQGQILSNLPLSQE
jgi:hypothetical protein